jgi:hypothetical protein
MEYIEYMQQNKSLKPTVTRVTPFAEMAKPTPRYGGLVPPLGSYGFKHRIINREIVLMKKNMFQAALLSFFCKCFFFCHAKASPNQI